MSGIVRGSWFGLVVVSMSFLVLVVNYVCCNGFAMSMCEFACAAMCPASCAAICNGKMTSSQYSQWVIESVSDRGRPREWNSSSQQLGICHSRSHYREWIIKVGMGIRTWTNYQRGLTYGSVWSMWSVWSMNSTLFSCPHSPDTTYRGDLVIRSLPTPHCWKTLP